MFCHEEAEVRFRSVIPRRVPGGVMAAILVAATVSPRPAAGSVKTIRSGTTPRVLSWGDNSAGELGDATLTQSSTAVTVHGLTGWRAGRRRERPPRPGAALGRHGRSLGGQHLRTARRRQQEGQRSTGRRPGSDCRHRRGRRYRAQPGPVGERNGDGLGSQLGWPARQRDNHQERRARGGEGLDRSQIDRSGGAVQRSPSCQRDGHDLGRQRQRRTRHRHVCQQ